MPLFAIIFGALMLIGLVAWLLAEINADRKWQDSIKPTVHAKKTNHESIL